jgi:galactokinase
VPNPTLNSISSGGFFSSPEPVLSFFAPGRINIIGEHLDYNGGYVFPAAVSLGITGHIQRRADRLIRLKSKEFPGEITVSLDEPIIYDPARGWANYPLGALKYLRDSGYAIPGGCSILYSSTLPGGSGLSSSAALEVLTAFMLAGDAAGSAGGRAGLALLMRDMENEFIGVRCGVMDQFTVALARKGHALLLNTETMDYTCVPVDLAGHTFVIMNSNVPRALSGSKYNERRAECGDALDLIRKARPALTTLAKAVPEDVALIDDPVLARRARHVITENGRVLAAVEALRGGDTALFGRLLTESHESLRRDYEVTGPELDALVRAALESPGCAGARMTGAGFGGCAIALVRDENADEFQSAAARLYRDVTGLAADFYTGTPGDGVREITPAATAGVRQEN